MQKEIASLLTRLQRWVDQFGQRRIIGGVLICLGLFSLSPRHVPIIEIYFSWGAELICLIYVVLGLYVFLKPDTPYYYYITIPALFGFTMLKLIGLYVGLIDPMADMSAMLLFALCLMLATNEDQHDKAHDL